MSRKAPTPKEGITSNEPQDRLEQAFERQREFLGRLVKRHRLHNNPADLWHHCQQDLDSPGHDAARDADGADHPLCSYHTMLAVESLQRHAQAIIMEGAELLDWTPWKHWSTRPGNKSSAPIGSPMWWHEVRTEIADLYCFLIDAAIDAGMDAKTLDHYHRQKVGINYERQDKGGY